MHWNQAGQINTDNTIKMALAKAKELGIKHIVIASNTGASVQKLLGHEASEINLVAVTHHFGFSAAGENEMPIDERISLKQQGVQIFSGTHLFAGADRGVRNHFGGVYPAEIMAQTLRLFGQGVKVAVEIAVMALDAGLIPYGEDIISIAGTVRGADAAIIICPAHSNHIFDTEVREIITMPGKKK